MTRCDRIALACCAFYLGLGSLWIDKPGLQADEVLFTGPLFDPGSTVESMTAFHRYVPLMLISYLGCLKTWLYAPLIFSLGPSPAVIRLPMVVLGAFTIWVIYRVISRLHSERAGAIVTILLATDTLYLWLSRCDWGPVTLQHLLTASGVWILLRFYDTQRLAFLASGSFLFGLALWDKTVFLWPAAGLLTAAALLWRHIAPVVNARRVILALAFFALGAFPWIRHNIRQHGATFHDAGHFSTEELWHKTTNFITDLNGVSLLGYMIGEYGSPAGVPGDPVAAIIASTAQSLRFPRQSITGWVFLAALALSPFLGRKSQIAAVAFIPAFLLMVLTKGGGMWGYHAVILWPLPQVVIAFALVRLPKPLLIGSVSVIALAALAVTNTYFAQLHIYGGSHVWTDAVYRLPASLRKHANGREVKVIDWGILEQVQLQTMGTLPIGWGIERNGLTKGDLYLGHTPAAEIFPDTNKHLAEDAARSGCHLRIIETIADHMGTPMFQLQTCE